MNRSFGSIERAKVLMGTPDNVDNYVILKIMPDGGGCCCTDCWPETWRAVNCHIEPAGPIGHEGDVLLGHGDSVFVLEGHETGPEIIVYLTASLLAVKAVFELITTILKIIPQDRKRPSRIKLVKRYTTKGEFAEEIMLEIDLPLSDKTAKKIESQLSKSLTKHQTSRMHRTPR